MRCSINKPRHRALSIALAAAVLISTSPLVELARGDESASTSTPQSQSSVATKGTKGETAAPGPAPGDATPEELEELVSPIALYPDLLVARILVASTFPTQIVEAQRWLEQNPNLKGDQFAEAVNAQPWDPSVRSLSQFRDVLKTMNDSLSWTSALGEAYYNQPDDVMDAIQQLRNRAVKAGTLKDTPQQKVETKAAAPEPAEGGAPEGATQQQTVVIEPAQQNTVYVPQYNPTTAYGAPVAAPAGYVAPAGYTGTEMLATGLLSFGAGMGLMALINDGDDDWDCGWHGDGGGGGNTVNYNKNVYANRGNNYARGKSQTRQTSRQGRRDTRQAGRNPAATPYGGARRGAGAGGPTARPYNAASARPYRAGGPGAAKPTFPKASTLPANAGLGGASAAGRGTTGRGARGAGQGVPSNRQQNLAQQRRGYGGNTPNRSTRGGPTGAFGGYGAGGRTQAAGNRGRSSLGGSGGGGGFGGRGGGGGGRRGGGGGGGGGRRGGGGGGRGRR